MSLPSFPESGLDLTKEQVFHMLLGSIAMEELALSHIMNAEGEKLQYVLGTLPGAPKVCSTPQELLEVNRSVSDLLEKVSQNQILLKGKLAQILEAMDSYYPRTVEKIFCMFSAPSDFVWKCQCPLSLIPIYGRGATCFWKETFPCHIFFPNKDFILLNYSFQLSSNSFSPVSIALKAFRNETWEELFACETTSGSSPISICGNTVLCPKSQTQTPLLFCLKSPTPVTVKQATLSFMEL